MGEWLDKAYEDAADAAEYFLEAIVDDIGEHGEASTTITDYSESYHHESHIDRPYSLREAAELIDELGEYEETDSGLWEGAEPRRAIEIMAAFTYGNAVYELFKELMEGINEKVTELVEEGEEIPRIAKRKRWGPEAEMPETPLRAKIKEMVQTEIKDFARG